MNRRKFLQVAGLASSAVTVPTELLRAQAERSAQRADTKNTPFLHPGILQTHSQLETMKHMIQANEEPVASAWKRFMELRTASLDFNPEPVAHVFRSANGASRSGADEFSSSSQAAHSHALQWYVSGDSKHAQKSIEILDAWSRRLWDFSGNDAKLLAGWAGAYFCEAAELLRAYPGWKQESRLQFRHMLTRVLVPLLAPFFPEANGNWDGAIVFTVLAIAIYLDDFALFNRATNHFLHGTTNAGILKYVWPSGQCEESTRDQGHVQLGLGYFSYAAHVAWNQGIDLFGAGDSRLALGFEYTSKYMLGEDVPYFGVISPRGRGRFSDFYEAAYQHYRFDKKMDLPYTSRAVEKARQGRAISAVWLFRGGSKNDPVSPAPVPATHGADAGAYDNDLHPEPSWHRVSPGDSLQAAIDHAADGDTIVIEPGIHTLPSSIQLHSGLTLVGYGRKSMLHLAPGGGEYCLMQSSPKLERLTLRNFLIEGAIATDWPMDPNQPRRERSTQMAQQRGGILLNGDAEGEIRTVVLDHLTVRNCVSNGIAISGATNVTISACDLTDNGGNNAPGHGLNHNLLLNHVSQGTVSESRLVFSLGGSGISVQNSSHVTVQRNELSRNCGWGAEFLNCTDVQLRESLLEANDGGPYRSETDGVRSQVKVTSLVERLNGN
jgi:Alginate lyase/Right handed beta helix region